MSNHWWELTIACQPQLEDLVFWRLDKFGCRGMASEVKGKSLLIRAYLPQVDVQLLDLGALALWLRQDALVADYPEPRVQWHLLDEEDWASSWKQYWEPQVIGDRFLICPAWLDSEAEAREGRLTIRLDPGAAFGTGTHPTTQLCLESLEMRITPDSEPLVADVGCGSGVLAIGAVLLGARRAFAVDTDSLAVRAARANRDLNQISRERLLVERGSIDEVAKLASGPVDGLCCNILAEVIIEMIPELYELTKPKGWGIFSGILLEQAKPVADMLEEHGWVVATLWKRGEWCCFNVRKS